MSKKFSDFKNLSYDKAKGKLNLLKGIFTRLKLNELEERYDELVKQLDSLQLKIKNFQIFFQNKFEPPPDPKFRRPPPPPEPPIEEDEEEEPTEELYPNLSISVVPVTRSNSTEFQVTVINSGTKESPATDVVLNLLPENINSLSIPALEIGESYTTSWWYFYDPAGDPETKTLLAEVNSYRSFVELSYADNQTSVVASVKKQHVITDGYAYVILHSHNAENKEIGGLQNHENVVWDFLPSGGSFIGATNINNHGELHQVTPGTYAVTVYWNNITINKSNVILEENTITELFVEFPRTEAFPLNDLEEYLVTDVYPPAHPALWYYRQFLNWIFTGTHAGTNNMTFNLTSNMFLLFLKAVNTQLEGEWSTYVTVGTNDVYPDGVQITPIPPSLPSSFDNWYCQSIQFGNYVNVGLSDNLGHTFGIIGSRPLLEPEPYYQCIVLDDSTIYHGFMYELTKLYVSYPTQSVTATPSNPSVEKIITGTLISFKMSSVPYDLLGTGF